MSILKPLSQAKSIQKFNIFILHASSLQINECILFVTPPYTRCISELKSGRLSRDGVIFATYTFHRQWLSQVSLAHENHPIPPPTLLFPYPNNPLTKPTLHRWNNKKYHPKASSIFSTFYIQQRCTRLDYIWLHFKGSFKSLFSKLQNYKSLIHFSEVMNYAF